MRSPGKLLIEIHPILSAGVAWTKGNGAADILTSFSEIFVYRKLYNLRLVDNYACATARFFC